MFSQLFKNRLIRFLLLAIISIQAYALPPDIEKDKLMKQLEKALVANNFEKAETVFKKLEPLRKEHGLKMPKTYWYYRGQTQLNVGNPSEAIKHLETYLEKAGEKAGYYDKALELYGLAEEMQIEIKLRPIRKAEKAKSDYTKNIHNVTGSFDWNDRYVYRFGDDDEGEDSSKKFYMVINKKIIIGETDQACRLSFSMAEDFVREAQVMGSRGITCDLSVNTNQKAKFELNQISSINESDYPYNVGLGNAQTPYPVTIYFNSDIVASRRFYSHTKCNLESASNKKSYSKATVWLSSKNRANEFISSMKALKEYCEIIAP